MNNPRFDARSAMIFRVSLSVGARLLYMALDDMARDRGDWFVKQLELARKLGWSRREIQQCLYELRDAGHIAVEQTGRSAKYTLAWACGKAAENLGLVRTGMRTSSAQWSAPGAQGDAHRHLSECFPGTSPGRTTARCGCGSYFSMEGEQGHCQLCRHVHAIACDRCTRVVSHVEEARALLVAYVRECRLSWAPPDDAICGRVLTAAGGLVELYPALKDLLRSKRAVPGRSYAWFATVLSRQKVATG